MNFTDLELYKWKVFRDIHLNKKSIISLKYKMSFSSYWKEYAAFMSILPRRFGKTKMLCDMITNIMATSNNNVFVVSHNKIALAHLKRRLRQSIKNTNTIVFSTYNNDSNMLGYNFGNYDLIIDNFLLIDQNKLNAILNNAWKTVTMASSML